MTENGANLSGGQRQRLGLARALLHNSPVYLFDEATSNIDAESEDDIMSAIRAMRGKRTVILISHRLANVMDCDTIYTFAAGHGWSRAAMPSCWPRAESTAACTTPSAHWNSTARKGSDHNE